MQAITHSGVFHGDDVFSAALLTLIYPNIKIKRVKNSSEIPDGFNGIVFDIGYDKGYTKFDHHQENNEKRKTGIPYAAFGKLWRKFGSQLLPSKKIVELFDLEFVQPLDRNDCTGTFHAIANVIKHMNNPNDTPEERDAHFSQAVSLALEILNSELNYYRELARYEEYAITAIQNKVYPEILLLEEYIPLNIISEHDKSVKFVIYPSERGGYAVYAIKDNGIHRILFPNDWLQSSPKDYEITFIHQKRFLLITPTKESAIDLANLALQNTHPERN